MGDFKRLAILTPVFLIAIGLYLWSNSRCNSILGKAVSQSIPFVSPSSSSSSCRSKPEAESEEYSGNPGNYGEDSDPEDEDTIM